MAEQADASGSGETEAGLELARSIWRHMAENDPVVRGAGIELTDVGPGRAQMTMTVRPDMANGIGSCHGGLIFPFADSCSGLACNTYNRRTLAFHCDIRFLQAALVGDHLIATATETWRSSRNSLYDVMITREDEAQVAIFRGHAREVAGTVIEMDAP